MSGLLTSRVGAALVSGVLAFGAMGAAPASAMMHHGGGHYGGHYGGWHGHYAGGYHRYYRYGYGGGYYGGPYYYGSPCVPVLGLVTGNFCNGYYY